MGKKLNCVLLIDDDQATNFLHRMAIEEHGCCKKIITATDGEEALTFLSTPVDGRYPCPEFIFLDINMPRVDGWDFLEAYRKLPEEQRGGVVIVMLTTSLNPRDRDRARKIKEIADFRNKLLTEKMLEGLIAEYFAE